MPSTAHAISSIDLVKTEIDATILLAETSLANFIDNRDDGEVLQNCIDCLNQLRGIFTLIEVRACVLLCQEAVSLANEVPVGAGEDKNALLSSLSKAIFTLRRYGDYYARSKRDIPELLLPAINELRQAQGEQLLPESHFFDLALPNSSDLACHCGADAEQRLDNFDHHARRFRHMYQVGLLDLLKDRNQTIAFNLIARASLGAARLCAGQALAELWVVSKIVAEAMNAQKMLITPPRKRLFMGLERYLRNLVKEGAEVAEQAAPKALIKELLYLLSLSDDKAEQSELAIKTYQIPALELDDASLQAEAKRLFGPGPDALRSLSQALSEELNSVKEKLDVMDRNADPDPEDLAVIAERLAQVNGTLKMLDLPQTTALSEALQGRIASWQVALGSLPDSDMMALADGILMLESSLKHFESTGLELDLGDSTQTLMRQSSSYLAEAMIVVADEAKTALVLAKRAISAFIDSEGDKMHLANVVAVLHSVGGAMAMIQQPRAQAIALASSQCVQEALVNSDQMPEATLLETLADALTSLEYFIESLGYQESENEDLLKLAEDSLSSISYPC